jgi:hypothetical protein
VTEGIALYKRVYKTPRSIRAKWFKDTLCSPRAGAKCPPAGLRLHNLGGACTLWSRAGCDRRACRQRKDLTPYELSKELVRKAVQLAPIISTAAVEKDRRGRKAAHGSPKAEIAAALGTGTTTLVRAEQHVAAMERYPVLGGPEVSQKQALELGQALDTLSSGEEWWSNARRNPIGPPPKDAKDGALMLTVRWFFKRLGAAHTMIFCIFWGRS